MTACHHDEKKTEETTTTTTDSTTVVAAPKPEEKEEPKKEEPKEHDKPKPEPTRVHHDSLKVDKGMPIIKDTAGLKEKPKDESSIGGATKKHVKPGGIKGHSN
jgi:outer membrane biosynthesis protein TonB